MSEVAIVAGVLIGAGILFVKLFPWSAEDRAFFAYLDWRHESRRRGLDFEDATEELRLREHLAKVRRIASDAALRSPRDGYNIVDKTIAIEARAIGNVDKARARQFAKAAKSWRIQDILYPEAMAAVNRANRLPASFASFQETEDQIAAMRLMR